MNELEAAELKEEIRIDSSSNMEYSWHFWQSCIIVLHAIVE